MSYVSSNNIGDDDEDLDWTIFDTYYQGFWYLNLNPFKVGLGRGGQRWKSVFLSKSIFLCLLSLSHTVNEIFAQTRAVSNLCVRSDHNYHHQT